MNLVEEIGLSLMCAFFGTLYFLYLFSPVIFSILYARNVRKHKNLKKEWEGTTDGHLIATLEKKRKYIKFYLAALIAYIALYIAFVIYTQFTFLMVVLFLPLMALYAVPWYLVSFAVVSFTRFMLYRGKDGDTEEQIIKERKKRKIIFIVSSIVAIIVFILYSTVIFKSLSEISFM